VTISIVTPSFRQLPWLKRCIRSVSDQSGVGVEHIVQDAGSGQELEKWVADYSSARLFVEEDSGMYDAINRGLGKSSGAICAFLNSDEQYLPGTLEKVARTFEKNPAIDLIAGDFLVLSEKQKLLAYRKATPLRSAMIRTDHLYDHSCAIFFRRRVWEAGFVFDTRLRAVADAEWVCRVLDAGFRTMVLPEYLSTFTVTGHNLGVSPAAVREAADQLSSNPRWLRVIAPALREYRHAEKLLRGGYKSGPITYEVFAGEDDERRTRFVCDRPSSRYPDM
jgi:glycosyltransferase involved in cell wall biosynthesis